MNAERRVGVYRRQPAAGRRLVVLGEAVGGSRVAGLTPRQSRRLRHKVNHQDRAARLAAAVVTVRKVRSW